ncbi:hypothetical protein BUALT_Bualt08G0031500 [Buddleja alternifolia]|uniref:Inositol-tetrakisphosphate 1-kinase n=1 Tax=Buddleja alternifolia TaxID=168488 RepID=A0AAV6X4W8_9LAMI|nr:hypothetical protein BUALT_Bualt08G0031500 [Buddleja alternifolia]
MLFRKQKEVQDVEEDKLVAALGGYHQPETLKVVVGYALTSKKIKSFLQPKLQGLARNKGILFVAIDQSKPLSDQGPFDVLLHKLFGKEWRHILEVGLIIRIYIYDYRKTHPNVTVLDPPDAIQHVHSRQSMLQDVADLNLSDAYGKVGVPKQLVIKKDTSSIPDAVNKAGLRLPIVAKPLVAKSHELSLAYDEFSLQLLDPPLVLQEFINHGGVLFKVYIVGEAIKVVRRFSLPDVSKRELSQNAGVYHFPRVSCAAASADEADLDPCVAVLHFLLLVAASNIGQEHIPEGYLSFKFTFFLQNTLLDHYLRDLLGNYVVVWYFCCNLLVFNCGLRLFNLDIIREHGTRDSYYVIDINYFPGYGKMPGYEHIFTDFLLNLVKSK